jgi:ketosteroid isomerase-like protein
MVETESHNEQLVREFLETLSTGDLEALRPLLHQEASREATGKSIPGAGVTKGCDTIIDDLLTPVRGLFEAGDPKIIVLRIFGMDTHYILTQLDRL